MDPQVLAKLHQLQCLVARALSHSGGSAAAPLHLVGTGDAVQLSVRAFAGQASLLQTWNAAGGGVVASVSPAGAMQAASFTGPLGAFDTLQGSAGGNVAMPVASELTFTQTAAAIGVTTSRISWLSQPLDPSGIHMPFSAEFINTAETDSLGNPYWDPAIGVGYNMANTAGEPSAAWVIEADYTNTTRFAPNTRTIEMYWNLVSTDRLHNARPLSAVYATETGRCDVGFETWRTDLGAKFNWFGDGFQFMTLASNPGGGVGMNVNTPGGFGFNFSIATSNGGIALSPGNGDITVRQPNAGGNGAYVWASAVGGFVTVAGDTVNFATRGLVPVIAFDSVLNQLAPTVDNVTSLGTNAFRWSLVRGTVITSGDLDLCDEEHGAHWTLREEPDCLVAVNRMTDQWFKLTTMPLTSDERTKYEGARTLKTTSIKHTDVKSIAAERAKSHKANDNGEVLARMQRDEEQQQRFADLACELSGSRSSLWRN